MEISKPDTLSMEVVQMRRPDVRIAMRTYLSVALIIRKYKNNIRSVHTILPFLIPGQNRTHAPAILGIQIGSLPSSA